MRHFYVFSFALWIYSFIEIYFRLKFKSKSKEKRFDISLYFITLSFLIILLIPVYKFICYQYTPNEISFILFLSTFFVGLVLRLLGLREIQYFFSHKVELQHDHKVINTGIYKCIRHPLYLGSFIMALGTYFYYINAISSIFLFALLLGIFLRINKEEAYLISNLPGYADYMHSTKKFIPKIF